MMGLMILIAVVSGFLIGCHPTVARGVRIAHERRYPGLCGSEEE